MDHRKLLTVTLSVGLLALAACRKNTSNMDRETETPYSLSYGDSVIFLQPSVTDYIISPVTPATGTYTAFPEGLELDANTGAINVTESETGLRYRVTYKAPDGKTWSTVVLLSGINYPDRYYNLASGDSISFPIYNGVNGRALPAGAFDPDGSARSKGCAISGTTGQINLAQTFRSGFFAGAKDATREVEISYSLNDGSKGARNQIKVLLYYYKTVNDVPNDVKQILAQREGMVFGVNPALMPSGLARDYASRPRPPCVIIIGR